MTLKMSLLSKYIVDKSYGNEFDKYYIESDRTGDRLREQSVFEIRIMGLISY